MGTSEEGGKASPADTVTTAKNRIDMVEGIRTDLMTPDLLGWEGTAMRRRPATSAPVSTRQIGRRERP
jgi:hypothetical protein